jgi:ankyrin repeat protein
MDILAWKPEGPTLLTKVDSSGKSPLHFAVLHYNLDAVELLLNVEASLVRISDKDGLYPLHAAAMVGSTRIIDELITKCHDYYEMVDDKGRNFLHCAVEHARDKVVDHICRNDKFDMLLNATDDEGNTPLHLAVKHGHPRIVTLLLQTMSVKTCIINKNGLTVLDLAHEEVLSGSNYFLVCNCSSLFCLYASYLFLSREDCVSFH